MKTSDGIQFFCLPSTALCKACGKNPETVVSCPLGRDDCTPYECEDYTELEAYPFIATIQTDAGKGTIVYNGIGECLTCVIGDDVEKIPDAKPANVIAAIEMAYKLYSDPVWEFERITPPRD